MGVAVTPEQKTELQAYINQLKDLMALKDWRVDLLDELCSEDAFADIAPVDGRKWAKLRVSAGFFTEPSEQQRLEICHELIHCHVHPISTLVREDIAVSFGGDAHQVVKNAYCDRMEYAVDGIADGWAPFLPLPDFGVVPSSN